NGDRQGLRSIGRGHAPGARSCHRGLEEMVERPGREVTASSAACGLASCAKPQAAEETGRNASMSTMPAPLPRRHALGLPAGSIRALLALGILGLLWGLALKNPHELPKSFIYLLFLMLLILAHYFAAHGKSVGPVKERSALGLPRGSIRFLLMAGFVGLAYYLYRTDTQFVYPDSGPLFFLIALLLSGFFVCY